MGLALKNGEKGREVAANQWTFALIFGYDLPKRPFWSLQSTVRHVASWSRHA